MTYFPQVKTTPNDNLLDPFYRPIVVEPFTVFDSKQLFDNAPLFWDDSEVSGTGTTSTHDTDTASTTLAVSASTAGKRVRQTFQYFNYQPGKGQQIICTFVGGTSGAGVVKEVGYFDDDNGVFFKIDGTTNKFVKRSNATGTPVDTEVSQASWNLDPLDGTGDSGVTLDVSKSQIFFVGFEWLGVGSIIYGFFNDGQPILCHAIHNANVLDVVYMSTPNLPLRYSIENTGAGGALDFEHICSTVISYGGIQQIGSVFSIDRGVSAFSTGNNTSVHPVLSIRKKSAYKGAVIELSNFATLDSSNGTALYRYAIILNPTIAGTDNASWTSLTNSAIEYDVSRDNTNTLSGGTVVFSGYTAGNQASVSESLSSPLRLGFDLAGNADEFVLAMQNVSASNNTFLGSLTWRELL